MVMASSFFFFLVCFGGKAQLVVPLLLVRGRRGPQQ